MKKIFLVIALALTSMYCLNAQERVYMPFFEVMNMHPDYQYSTSKLFKTYVDSHSKYQIVLPAKTDTIYLNEPFDLAKSNAAAMDCPYFVLGEFNRIGEVVVVTITLYSTNDGKKVWNSLSKALTPDDIDPILERISANLGIEGAGNEGDIYNVTGYESKELNKIGANKYIGFTIGGGYSFVSDIDKNFPAGIGMVGSYDMRDFIFNIKGEMYFSDINVYYFSIEAMKPLSSAKNTAFVSGAMGYGGIDKRIDPTMYYFNSSITEGGLFLFAGGGYLMNRNSNVSLKFSGNIYTPVFEVDGTVPVGILFTTTILFGK